MSDFPAPLPMVWTADAASRFEIHYVEDAVGGVAFDRFSLECMLSALCCGGDDGWWLE